MAKLPPNILSNAKKGQKLSDGGGLYLYAQGIDEHGTPRGSWVYRYTIHGKSRDYSIGRADELTLAQAREIRAKLAIMVKRDGICPLEKRRQDERTALERREAHTLATLAPLAFEAIKPRLKGDMNAKRWYGVIELHLIPTLGVTLVHEITQHDIVRAIRPLWADKYPTAQKALDRLRSIFKHGIAHGIDADIQAIENARIILGEPTHKVKPHPALPASEAARLYQSLDDDNPVELALMVYLLTGGGARTKPIRETHINQIRDGVWYFDGGAMKGRADKTDDFRIPVTATMQKLLTKAASDCVGGYPFSTLRSYGNAPTPAKISKVSDQSLENIMRAKEQEWGWKEPYRLHGIRSTFRSWTAENFPSLYAVAETALAHKVGGVIERTYQRNDFLEQRRELLESWANHLQGQAVDSADIVPIRKIRGGG